MQLYSQRRGPSGNRLLFRMQGISLVIQPILGGLDLMSRNLLLYSLPLNHFPLGIFYWFSIQIHSLMVRLLEIHFGNLPCRRSTTPSSRTELGIWFPFLLAGKISDASGSTGPRAQWMDTLAYTKPILLPKDFSKCMVLTIMRPSLEQRRWIPYDWNFPLQKPRDGKSIRWT
jgi:hypothetical protein